ncbi:hypothetical protein EDB85DRAFT_2251181 [Lactarius pseudohatsudake]|nr:hypothetical protein EDB85DRAFT_2251181 [Lactarius pseudohatsudake]
MRAPSPPGLPLTCGHSRNFAAASHPYPLPLDCDPATSLRPRHPGSTDPATTRTPRRHLDKVATVTSLRRFHQRHPPRPRCTSAVSTRPPLPTVIAICLVHPTPPHRRRFNTAHHWHRDAGTAVVHPTPPHGAVSTRPPPPPDSTHHTGMAATATSLLHLSPPHLSQNFGKVNKLQVAIGSGHPRVFLEPPVLVMRGTGFLGFGFRQVLQGNRWWERRSGVEVAGCVETTPVQVEGRDVGESVAVGRGGGSVAGSMWWS